MLDAFRIKSFDLEPIYEKWTDGPVFTGNPKDLSVEEWLDQMKEGCIRRGVPEEYWYKVAQHFMGSKARARLDELKQVIRKVHGGKYRWTWKKFRIALLNMGWEFDKSETKTVKFSAKSLGVWFMRKKDDSEANLTEEPEPMPVSKEPSRSPSRSKPTRSNTRRGSISELMHSERSVSSRNNSHSTSHSTTRPPAKRSATLFSGKDTTQRPDPPVKTRSEIAIPTRKAIQPSSPTRSQTVQVIDINSPQMNSNDNGEVTNITQAPVWLLNACNALDFITSEHPKAMSVLSAILITVGSIPAIPAISAGAGGAVLASGAAHAIGAIAVGVGQALNMSVKNQAQNQNQSSQGNSNTVTQK